MAVMFNVALATCGVNPEDVRVRVVNMMPSVGFFAKVSVQSSDGKNIRGLKYGKGKGFLKKAPGAITFTATSDLNGGQILGPGAFPSSLVSGHDYTMVLNRMNDGTSSAANLILDWNRADVAPGDGYARVFLINAMVGHTASIYLGGNLKDASFPPGDTASDLLHAPGPVEYKLVDNTNQQQIGDTITINAKENTTYFVIFGGTTEPNDVFDPIVNLYKAKY
jgi:hypothetical protein